MQSFVVQSGRSNTTRSPCLGQSYLFRTCWKYFVVRILVPFLRSMGDDDSSECKW